MSMKLKLLLPILLLQTFNCIAQTNERYDDFILEGENFYQEKKYRESGLKYSEAFIALGNKGLIDDRYNAACSWALAGETDSAFVQLFKIARSGNYTNLVHISNDTDLKSIHTDTRWQEVIDLIEKAKEKQEAHFDHKLVARLDTIYERDQALRLKITEMEEKFGRESEEMQAIWKEIQHLDSLNIIEVSSILDRYGWIGPDKVGMKGNSTLFLVIQHADLSYQEKYLPLMKDAVSKGNARASSLALLEDRVALRKGGLQKYGSQIGFDEETNESYVLPLEDPERVNERRSSVGLGSIEDYVSRWKIKWDPEDYKKKLPGYIAKQKPW